MGKNSRNQPLIKRGDGLGNGGLMGGISRKGIIYTNSKGGGGADVGILHIVQPYTGNMVYILNNCGMEGQR
jgi:hypothetical protein